MAERAEESKRLSSFLARPSLQIHMIGAGGVGMAGLAVLLHKAGHKLSGSELNSNIYTDWLLDSAALVIHEGHKADLIHPELDLVIRSSAIPADNVEMMRARELNIPVFNRGDVLASYLHQRKGVAVAGTHGKTTTTAMIKHIALSAGKDIGYFVGAAGQTEVDISSQGTSDWFVAEADESDATLLQYHPEIAVITNIEFDHLETFGDEQAFVDAFKQFADQSKKIIYNADDRRSIELFSGKGLSFGIDHAADITAHDIRLSADKSCFKLRNESGITYKLSLQALGKHNVSNALAAWAVATEIGVPVEEIISALASFCPVNRRFEVLHQSKDFLLVNDYAHHPTEIHTVFNTVKEFDYKRLIAVFQPHRYSRTKAMLEDFPEAFSLADEIILCPVYAASEQALAGGDSGALQQVFNERLGVSTYLASDLNDACLVLKDKLKEGDALLIIGAGDVEKIAFWAKDHFESR